MKKFIGSLLVLIFCFSFNVSAKVTIDTSKKASITINHSYENVPLSGAQCKIYKVATLSSDGNLEITDEFKEYPVQFNRLSDKTEWYQIADTLDSYIKAYGIPHHRTDKTSENGIVSFSDLDLGLYLVNVEDSNYKDKILKSKPVLVSLPSVNDKNDIIHHITINPKFESMELLNNNLKVNKIWLNDEGLNVRPNSIKVNLYKNGEVVDSVVLSEENNWSHTWEKLSSNFEWTAIEENVPEGYKVSYEKYNGVTTIKNNYGSDSMTDGMSDSMNDESNNSDSMSDDSTSKPSKTGDKALVLPFVMLGVGLILLFVSRKK